MPNPCHRPTGSTDIVARVTRVLVIDSYDSFVYNLVQYLGELGADPIVHRNDRITVDEALALRPRWRAGVARARVDPRRRASSATRSTAFADVGTPVLGVCLGHQAIGHVYGADVVRAPQLMHGKTSPIEHDGAGVFAGLPSPLTATRYHSLVLDPDDGARRARGDRPQADGIVMGVRHREVDVEGVQFHPESILTGCGHDLLQQLPRPRRLTAVSRRVGRDVARPESHVVSDATWHGPSLTSCRTRRGTARVSRRVGRDVARPESRVVSDATWHGPSLTSCRTQRGTARVSRRVGRDVARPESHVVSDET